MYLQKSINYLMLAFAFVFPISGAVANILLALMLILWLTEGNFKQKFYLICKEKFVLIFFAIGCLVLLSAFFSFSLTDGFITRPGGNLYKSILSHYIWLPILFMIFTTSIQKEYLSLAIASFLASIFFSEIISYLIYFQYINVHYFQNLHLLYHIASAQNPAPFMHHISYSLFLSIAILLIIDQLLTLKNKYLQLLTFIFLSSAITNLFINGGRTGQIAFILAVLTYVLAKFKSNLKMIFLSLGILVFTVGVAYNTSPTFKERIHLAKNDIQSALKGNYVTSWGLRIASNMVAIDYLLDSPQHFILGAGAGDARKEYLEHAKQYFPAEISGPIAGMYHLHNQYLQYWFDGTLFALLLLLYYFYQFFRLPLRADAKPLLFAIIVIIMFSLMPNIPFFTYKTAFLIFFITSYFVVMARETNDNNIH